MKLLRCLLALCCTLATAQTKLASIAEKTTGATAMPGYFPLYWDAKAGKMWLEISRWNTEFLYLESLPAGLGSNDVGLDRGQTGRTSIVRFERVGPKVLLIQPNYAFRALSDNPAERRAVSDSFAQSVLFGFTVEAEEGNRVLVDATSFFLRDVHQVTRRLIQAKQGAFHLDAARSAFYLDHTKSFPKNTEVEVTLTFAGEQPGGFVQSVTPSPDSITVREHHSLVELPPPGYQPRALNPNSGFFGIEYFDFATPISEPIRKQFLARHRLQKKDPAVAVSEAVQPIRYYLDPGAPEPIRSALLEGARWWNQAFEAAGFRNAFQVEMLPADADPMDVRYNLIQWVHRSTRGWSYGASITDPRTGEIIKGQVTLGSLRVRQDFLIAEGWLAPYAKDGKVPGDMERMALSRLRQLAAHEVGHTLGLAHNFAASAHNRASVMDYPHPLIKLNAAGDLDLSDAYATGIGDWDKVAINFGYRDFGPAGDDPARLVEILRFAQARGLTFITDEDSRPAGGAHPSSHLWDSGANPVDELNRMLALRAKALTRFGEASIRMGRPWSTLEEVLVPLYLAHRYQVEAASKLIGGVNYTYALRGDGQVITERVPPAEQRRALTALVATIKPETLTLPERILALIPPRAFDFPKTREDFPQRTGLTFDPVSAAESAADLTVSFLLHPQRAARLVEEGSRGGVGLGEVIEALLKETWNSSAPGKGLEVEVRRRVAQVVLTRLIMLALDESTSPQARAVAHASLMDLYDRSSKAGASSSEQAAHLRYGARQIELYLRDPKQFPMPKLVETPPGQPIGCDWQP